MKLSLTGAVCALALLFALPASAQEDAGAADVVEPDAAEPDAMVPDPDATDNGTTDVMDPDAMEPDTGVVDPDAVEPDPDTVEPTDTGDTGQFSNNICWDESCGTETDACKADPQCVEYNECYQNDDNDCLGALAESNPDSQALHQALRECGWTACNDPSAGSCGDAGQDGADNRCGQWSDDWPCNCDDACSQFSDCCNDYDAVCGGGGGTDGGGTDGGNDCVPACGNAVCGDDGCGGSCGNCAPGMTCNALGQCAGGCTDECATGEVKCAQGQAWTCETGDDGCLFLMPEDCAAAGQVCEDGACIDAPGGDDTGDGTTDGTGATTGETTAGTGDGGTDEAGDDGASTGSTSNTSTSNTSGGCSSTGAGDAAPVALLAFALLALALRRRMA
jgi:MYXO-CTERM domain-containing protein